MHNRIALTRRRLLTGAAAGLIGGFVPPALAAPKVTDLEGLDGLWRDAEDAIDNFFPRAEFDHAGINLDLPQHADVGSSVPLTVRIDSAMTEADHPFVVHILAHKNPTPHVLSAWFKQNAGRAEFSTRIRLEISQTVTAVAQMVDGRHLRVDRDVSVSFGACGQIGTGTQDEVFAFMPKTRVSVPPRARKGEIIPIRALISHPQETGLRLNSTLEWIRERIVSRIGCTFDGVEFFKTRPQAAVATNPYFQFYARAEKSGVFNFSWYDTRYHTYTDSASIIVA
ncbi:MAG: thiosulfate oxidation carrier complex protein SoxZ [Albidovulum sp.]|nr:thiosulfate oxidation carrier complex protein SoxZ [Albidovulum sp.]